MRPVGAPKAKPRDAEGSSLAEVEERLKTRLKGRSTSRINGLAKKSHDPAKQDALLAHLDHEKDNSEE